MSGNSSVSATSNIILTHSEFVIHIIYWLRDGWMGSALDLQSRLGLTAANLLLDGDGMGAQPDAILGK
jgi:hypothetical protein